ncbi:MAG: glycosyltransferase [Thomasclavelia sp.]
MATHNGQNVKKQMETIKSNNQKEMNIIINNCSNDDTVKILNNFIQDNQLIEWVLEENNLRYTENLKNGLMQATGGI